MKIGEIKNRIPKLGKINLRKKPIFLLELLRKILLYLRDFYVRR